MAEKNRIRNLSTRWLVPFKIVLFSVYTGLCVMIAYFFVDDANNLADWFGGLLMATTYCYIFYRLMIVTSKLYQVEFDQDFLYVIQRNQDMIIPLENIESVEIATLGGVYKVNLFHGEQLGNHFYFKLSLFYPLNASSKDELVNVLRRYIVKARSKPSEQFHNALHS